MKGSNTVEHRKSFATLVNLTLLLGSTALILLLAEVGLRVSSYIDRRESLVEALEGTEHPPPGAEVTLGQMIRVASNPRIIYELRPGLDVIYRWARVFSNDLGFRDSSTIRSPGRNSYRILGIGDSVMFGQGIEFEQTYLARLASRLERRFPHRSWEVVNTAVPGYNTVMEVATLKEKALPLQPDLVVIDVVDNDLALPNFIPVPDLRPHSGGLRVWDLLASSFARVRGLPQLPAPAAGPAGEWDPRGLVPTPATGSGEALFANRPELAPPQYSEFVGLAAFRRALEELKLLSTSGHFELVAVTMVGHETPIKIELKQVLEEVGIDLVDAGAAIVQYDREHKLPQGSQSPLRVSPEEAHPSALAHEIAATALIDRLIASKKIPTGK